MQIADEQEYQDALTELQRLQAGEQSDHSEHRRLELEAATAHYAEKLRGEGHRPGRPDPL